MRTNENMIRVIAKDLGEHRAAVLVSDALTGGDAAVLRLERLAKVRASRNPCDRNVLLISKRLPGGALWCGDTLTLPDALPESLGLAIVGLPIGRVVSGTGRDDCVIRETRTYVPLPTEADQVRRATTSIDVGSRMVDAADLQTTRAAMRMRGMRMLAARTHLIWHGQREDRFDMPVRDPLLESMLMIMLLAVFLAMIPFLYGLIFLVETRGGSRAGRPRILSDARPVPAAT